MMKLRCYFLLLLFFSSNCWSVEAALDFQISGETVKVVSLSELKNELQTHEISFYSTYYNKIKTYSAFSIDDILDFAYQRRWKSAGFSDIAFVAMDGYEAVSELRLFSGVGGFLAYQDLNAPQSITAYRSKKMILEFIRHASIYRYTQMPDHTDLSEHQLENLYLYLKHQARP